MHRLISAFTNSMRALRILAVSEKAVQQELVLLALSLPVGWFVATSWSGYGLLIGAVLFLLIVEILNTAIEAACDALSRDFKPDIQLAKDSGSLAVLLALLICAAIWIFALVERIWAVS